MGFRSDISITGALGILEENSCATTNQDGSQRLLNGREQRLPSEAGGTSRLSPPSGKNARPKVRRFVPEVDYAYIPKRRFLLAVVEKFFTYTFQAIPIEVRPNRAIK